MSQSVKLDSAAALVSVVLVTHPGIASSLRQQAGKILNDPLQGINIVEIHSDIKQQEQALSDTLRMNDAGKGVLILTDLPGATPCNFAQQTAPEHSRIVSGLNLPMLIRVWNYRHKPLDELAELAAEGGRIAIKGLS